VALLARSLADRNYNNLMINNIFLEFFRPGADTQRAASANIVPGARSIDVTRGAMRGRPEVVAPGAAGGHHADLRWGATATWTPDT
jgi:hypothetical protein